ncbi:hypothetical protein BT93_E0669 [Corymbia citriodora subsp. variegata]|nr:hypothetical protein BT93_E0669 [Corymbia citriodora subsp. variegata]
MTLQYVPLMAFSAIFFFAFFHGLSLRAFADDLNDICPARSCRPGGPEIRFPFRIRDVQPEQCGYPGFDLSCNDQKQAILQLPDSQDFVVSNISYEQRYIVLKDPSNCLARRLRNTMFLSSIFMAQAYGSFVFVDCTAKFLPNFGLRPVGCLSDKHHTVLIGDAGSPGRRHLERFGCRSRTVTVPVALQYPMDITESVTLEWDQPDCRSCEESGGRCGLNGSTGSQVGCFSKPGLSKSAAKLAIIPAVLVPSLLCMFGIACYLSLRARVSRHSSHRRQPPDNNNSENNVVDISSPPSPPGETHRTTGDAAGLDSLTIETYPKTQVGDDGGVPRPNDNICAICLSEYQPKETLRTIPMCGHYFHAQCIDHWHRRNASCPMFLPDVPQSKGGPCFVKKVQSQPLDFINSNNPSQAILQLPDSQDFIVDKINYTQQSIVPKDPSNCLVKRLQNTKFSSSLFVAQEYGSFKFKDCPVGSFLSFGFDPVGCLSDEHYKVLITDANDSSISRLPDLGCRTWVVSVPVSPQHPRDITESVSLKWDRPDCRWCEQRGGRCGTRVLKSDAS